MVSPSTLLNSPPSFQQGSKSDGYAGSQASVDFNSGNFNVGASSLSPLLIIGGLIFLAVTFIDKKWK